MTYSQRWGGGFVDTPTETTDIDSQFLNAVEAALIALYGVVPATNGVMVWDGTQFTAANLLKNAQVAADAAIAKSKLEALEIADADVAAAAAIAGSKIAFANNGIAGAKLLPVRVATTVAGLGTAGDGALGLVVCGSTPFDFIPVIYDATYAKWVSAASQILNLTSSGFSANNTHDVWGSLGVGTSFSYGAMVTAGLALQLRVTALLGGGNTDDIGVIITTYAAGAGATDASADAVIITRTGGLVMKDGGWLAAPTVTSDAYATIIARGRGSVDNSFNMSNLGVQARWVG